jgi:antitoxin ParD1/3/4
MNVKTTITLPEAYLEYAEKMVAEGAYLSVSSVIEAGLEKMMQEGDPLAGMADELRRRMELPRDQFLPWDGPAMAERIKTRLRDKHDKPA